MGPLGAHRLGISTLLRKPDVRSGMMPVGGEPRQEIAALSPQPGAGELQPGAPTIT